MINNEISEEKLKDAVGGAVSALREPPKYYEIGTKVEYLCGTVTRQGIKSEYGTDVGTIVNMEFNPSFYAIDWLVHLDNGAVISQEQIIGKA